MPRDAATRAPRPRTVRSMAALRPCSLWQLGAAAAAACHLMETHSKTPPPPPVTATVVFAACVGATRCPVCRSPNNGCALPSNDAARRPADQYAPCAVLRAARRGDAPALAAMLCRMAPNDRALYALDLAAHVLAAARTFDVCQVAIDCLTNPQRLSMGHGQLLAEAALRNVRESVADYCLGAVTHIPVLAARHAVRAGRLRLLQGLVDRGHVELFNAGDRKFDVLYTAVRCGRADIVAWIVETLSPDDRRDAMASFCTNRRPIDDAAERGHTATVRVLLPHTVDLDAALEDNEDCPYVGTFGVCRLAAYRQRDAVLHVLLDAVEERQQLEACLSALRADPRAVAALDRVFM